MSLGSRIKSVRGSLSQKEFSDVCKVGISTLRRYESGVNPPDSDFLCAIVDNYNVNPTWLLTGEGPVHKGQDAPSTMSTPEHKVNLKNIEEARVCQSKERAAIRHRILASAGTGVDFEVAQHVIDELRHLRENNDILLSDEEMGEAMMIAYSFCLPENKVSASLICAIVQKWLDKHTKTSTQD